jgi:predicted type IV restriction endonuclease
MSTVPAKAAERIKDALKRFQPILASAKARDVNESDTVVIVTDVLQYVFGYDKYAEITSEHMIRNTFCDLAVKLDGKLAFLLEVKAIGLDLKDNHVKQAIDYAANQGVEWVGLTNGCVWRVYKVLFNKPIEHECIVEFDMLSLSHRNSDHIDLLGILAKEGWAKARIKDFHEQKQALSRFTIAALLLSDSVLQTVRRELRRVVEVKVEPEEIRNVLLNEVLKREVLEGDKASAAMRQVSRAEGRSIIKEKDEPKAKKESPADASTT